MIRTISISDLLNQPAKHIEFYAGRFEDMEDPENVAFPHKHNFYEILWITHGHSKQTIDFKTYNISPSNLFFISPGQLHLFEQWVGIKGYCIMFSEDFFLQLFRNKKILFELSYLDNLLLNTNLDLDNELSSTLQPVVDLLIKETSAEIIQALLFVLLKKIQKFFLETNVNRNTNQQIVIFKKFWNLVDKNCLKKLSLSQYADMLNITAHHLNHVVKITCNKTACNIITDRIILEAKQLLLFSEDSISQISDTLNFNDSSYFSRYFRKNTGFSPSDFRMKSQDKLYELQVTR